MCWSKSNKLLISLSEFHLRDLSGNCQRFSCWINFCWHQLCSSSKFLNWPTFVKFLSFEHQHHIVNIGNSIYDIILWKFFPSYVIVQLLNLTTRTSSMSQHLLSQDIRTDNTPGELCDFPPIKPSNWENGKFTKVWMAKVIFSCFLQFPSVAFHIIWAQREKENE